MPKDASTLRQRRRLRHEASGARPDRGLHGEDAVRHRRADDSIGAIRTPPSSCSTRATSTIREGRGGDRLRRVGGDDVQARSRRRRRSAARCASRCRRRRPRARDLRDVAGRARPAVADAGADGGQEAAVPVQPGAGDPGAVVHSAAGHARRARHVRRHDPHAEGSRRRDGRGDGSRRRTAGSRRLQVPDAAGDPVVPASRSPSATSRSSR